MSESTSSKPPAIAIIVGLQLRLSRLTRRSAVVHGITQQGGQCRLEGKSGTVHQEVVTLPYGLLETCARLAAADHRQLVVSLAEVQELAQVGQPEGKQVRVVVVQLNQQVAWSTRDQPFAKRRRTYVNDVIAAFDDLHEKYSHVVLALQCDLLTMRREGVPVNSVAADHVEEECRRGPVREVLQRCLRDDVEQESFLLSWNEGRYRHPKC